MNKDTLINMLVIEIMENGCTDAIELYNKIMDQQKEIADDSLSEWFFSQCKKMIKIIPENRGMFLEVL